METHVIDIVVGSIVGLLVGGVLAYWAANRSASQTRDARIAEMSTRMTEITGELHALVSALQSTQTLYSTKLDEIRRRVIALEQKAHGFNLDGVPTFHGGPSQ